MKKANLQKVTIAAMVVAIACMCVLPTLGAATKERDWQEGKLTDIISEPYTVGYMTMGPGAFLS